jgi:hypothetical protein
MCQVERLEMALRVAGFWPRAADVEGRTAEEWREVGREAIEGLEGVWLVALVWVATAVAVIRRREAIYEGI